MEPAIVQENGVASHKVCTASRSPSGEQSGPSPSHSKSTNHHESTNHDKIISHHEISKHHETRNSLDPESHPLTCKFLSSLNAKEVVSPQAHGYHTFILQPEAYTKTLESLRQSDREVWEYVSDKLRHDLVDDKFLIIKMLSNIHESTSDKISSSIRDQLASITNNTSNEGTKQLVRDIRAGLSKDIRFSDPQTFLQPDQQFRIKSNYYPGVVVEIAYSQSFGGLRRKAWKLIVNSEGRVQLVIGLEIEGRKSFKISTWRPEFYRFENRDGVRMKTIIDRDIIRDTDGTLKSGSLRFCLKDFGEDLATQYPDADLTEEIAFDYGVLAEYLIDSEQYDVPLPPSRNIFKPEYPYSSDEELTPEDEEKFGELEHTLAARSEALDPDYS